jgi:hypothetical protein
LILQPAPFIWETEGKAFWNIFVEAIKKRPIRAAYKEAKGKEGISGKAMQKDEVAANATTLKSEKSKNFQEDNMHLLALIASFYLPIPRATHKPKLLYSSVETLALNVSNCLISTY